MSGVPSVPDEVIKDSIMQDVPKDVLKLFLKQKLGEIPRKGLREMIENPEAVLTRLGYVNAVELTDLFISLRPKYSVFMFELQEPLFKSLENLHDLLTDMGIEVYKTLTNYVDTKPTLWKVYMNKTLNAAHFFLRILGKPMSIVDGETKEVRKQYSLIKSIVTLRPNSKLATVSINSSVSKARVSLLKVLKTLLPEKWVESPQNLNFKDLELIRQTLKYVDKVGYLTLEFFKSKAESGYGKITYSGRRTKSGSVIDLRKVEEVKEKIVEAFESGSITRMHGILNTRGRCPYDDELNFGINFRENKMYVFSYACGRCRELLYNILYDLWKGVINELPKEEQKTLYDFFGS